MIDYHGPIDSASLNNAVFDNRQISLLEIRGLELHDSHGLLIFFSITLYLLLNK
jgi:hypothetical protein